MTSRLCLLLICALAPVAVLTGCGSSAGTSSHAGTTARGSGSSSSAAKSGSSSSAAKSGTAAGPAPLDVEQAVAACRRSISAKLY